MSNTTATRSGVGYVRVSTGKQALSLAAQETRIRAYAEREGITLVAVYADNGQSGKLGPEHRKGFASALDALDDGTADVLVATGQDRLSRRLDLLDVYRQIGTAGAGIEFTDESDPGDMSDPDLFMTAGIRALMAEVELLRISKRTRAGLAETVRRGTRLGRPVSDETRTAGRRAEALRADGLTLAGVADALTVEGYPTARGGRWHASTVSRMLRTLRLDREAAARREIEAANREDTT